MVAEKIRNALTGAVLAGGVAVTPVVDARAESVNPTGNILKDTLSVVPAALQNAADLVCGPGGYPDPKAVDLFLGEIMWAQKEQGTEVSQEAGISRGSLLSAFPATASAIDGLRARLDAIVGGDPRIQALENHGSLDPKRPMDNWLLVDKAMHAVCDHSDELIGAVRETIDGLDTDKIGHELGLSRPTAPRPAPGVS